MDESRYYGKYKGFVRDNDDPDQRGRIRVYLPSVMGTVDNKSTWTDWALPCFSGNGFDVPDNGTGVWVEFEQGMVDYAIWTGRWLAGKDKESSEAPAASKTGYPKNRVFMTAEGHKIEVSDNADSKYLRVTHANGTSVVDLANDGKVWVKSGTKVIVEAPAIDLISEDPSDAMALASKCMDELNRLKDAVQSHVDTTNQNNQTFSTHTHQLTSVGSPVAHTGVTTLVIGTMSDAQPPEAVQEVKSDVVKGS